MKFILSSILLLSVSIGWIQAHDVSEQVDELNERLREATASLEAMLDHVEEQGWDKLLRKALASTQEDRYLDSEVAEIERMLFGEVQEDMTTEQEQQDEIAKIEDLLRQDVTTQGWGSSISHAFHKVTNTVKKVAKKICDVTALEQEVKAVDQLLDAREQLQLASIQETGTGVDNVNLSEDELADIMSFLDQAEEQDWVELQKAEREKNSALGRLEALMDLANQRARVEHAQGGRKVTKEEGTVTENLIYRIMAKKLLKMLQDKA